MVMPPQPAPPQFRVAMPPNLFDQLIEALGPCPGAAGSPAPYPHHFPAAPHWLASDGAYALGVIPCAMCGIALSVHGAQMVYAPPPELAPPSAPAPAGSSFGPASEVTKQEPQQSAVPQHWLDKIARQLATRGSGERTKVKRRR